MVPNLIKNFIGSMIAGICIFAISGCGESNWSLFSSNDTDSSKSSAAEESLASYRERMAKENAKSYVAKNEQSGVAPVSANGRARTQSPHAVRADTLEILDQFITPEDVLDPIRPRLKEMVSQYSPNRYIELAAELVRESLVEQVANHLIYRRASEQLTDAMKPQLDKTVDAMERDRIGREFGGRETAYENDLVASGRTREGIREQLRRALIVESYLRDRLVPMIPEPRRDEIVEYYQDNIHEFTTDEHRQLLMIDVPVAAFLDRSRVSDREQAIALARQKARTAIQDAKAALNAGTSFEEVARKYSKFKASDGGDWGVIHEPLEGRWEIPSKRFFELPRGGVSEIIETEDSYFIVKCGKVEGGVTTPLSAAQQTIVQRIKNKRFRRMKAEFLQRELDQANIGEIDTFFRLVVRKIPQPQVAGTN